MSAQLKVTGIILMAGSGNRFGSALPKQFHRLAGKKIYQHTLERFLDCQLFDEIILVCPPDRMDEVKKESPPSVRTIAGGSTRQESTYLALLACDHTDIVCIHDAVRPFVTKEILQDNISKAIAFGAVNTCIPSTDTLVFAPDHITIEAIPLRSDYQRGQTPQTFQYPILLQAHRAALAQGMCNRSDDCSLVSQMGHPIHVTTGSEQNIKITTELDLCLADHILRLGQNDISMLSAQSSIRGKRYIVTGGTGGIGKAICELLQEQGAIPIPLSRSSPHFSADLTSYDSAQSAFQSILATYGPVDGLINSIGRLQLCSFSDLTHEEIEKQISTNLKALIYCCKCASLKSGAHIVNIASSSYARGRKDFTIYSSAKAAVVNFTQGLAEERLDLRINAVVPQRTKTQMRLANFIDEDPHSLLSPQQVAQEIISLLKQNAITGSVIEIRKKSS